jgi:hypothetical protein
MLLYCSLNHNTVHSSYRREGLPLIKCLTRPLVYPPRSSAQRSQSQRQQNKTRNSLRMTKTRSHVHASNPLPQGLTSPSGLEAPRRDSKSRLAKNDQTPSHFVQHHNNHFKGLILFSREMEKGLSDRDACQGRTYQEPQFPVARSKVPSDGRDCG